MMRLLDLFSGAGGAGEGYRRAGFHVVSCDSADSGSEFANVTITREPPAK
ncbi:MAG TPA: hypothetical protein VKQ30_25390 [Ktedonobacterales bacterium]|nr:hypothetical protein [Ktedonobacterales bacterium]